MREGKTTCAGSGPIIQYFPNLGDYLPTCLFMPALWTLLPAAHRQETEPEQLEQQLHVPEPRRRDAGTRRWGVCRPTLVSSAVFSESKLAGLRARPEFQAQPESSRTQPPLLLLACTVSCRRWSLQKMVGQLLWMAQIQHGWVNGKQLNDMWQKGWVGLPRKVPMKKTPKGTLMTGEVMLINQLGRNGVILRKMM